jgi:hypothetical protein
LADVDRERLGRLRAEWELAELRASCAKSALELAVRETSQRMGAHGKFDLDLDAGVVISDQEEPHG